MLFLSKVVIQVQLNVQELIMANPRTASKPSNTKIYPVAERNQRYLDGEVSHINSNYVAKLIFVVALVFLIIGTSAITSTLSMWFGNMNLEQNGLSAQAIITDQRTDSDSDNKSYYLSYSFTVSDSGPTSVKTFTNETEVNDDIYNQYAIGSAAKILYLPSNPATSAIPHPVYPVGLIYGFLMIVVAILAVLFGISELRKSWLLERKGVLISVEVLSVETYQRDNDEAEKLKITYKFKAPNDQIITDDKYVNHDSYTRKITQNTQLGVLYYDEKRYEVL